MYKEIGSEFWIDLSEKLEEKSFNLDFLNINYTDNVFLSSGENAIDFVLRDIKILNKKKIALLPSFTCHTVIEPFIKEKYEIYFYDINMSLECIKEDFLYKINVYNPSVVLIHSYFGFNSLASLYNDIEKIKENIIIIEDITQTLYSTFEHIDADYYVFSFRKWTALPDGGCAIKVHSKFLNNKPQKTNDILVKSKLNAFYSKYLYIQYNIGNKKTILEKLKKSEDILSNQHKIFKMSDISKKIQSNLSIDILRLKRRENFSTLLDNISFFKNINCIFDRVLLDNVPLYFPIYVKKERDKLQKYLINNDIYAPIVWPKPIYCHENIGNNVEWIYNHILCIPCDQRYDINDMKNIIDKLIIYEKNN